MALATLTARVDENDKTSFDTFCSNVGLNTSTAINLFVKAVLRENRIPFEITQSPDPFFSEANIAYVKKSVQELKAGKGKSHELIEVDDAYLYWQTQDKKTIKRINQLIKDIERNGCMNGIGKPEPLTGDLQGEYSRHINDKDRLVYHMEDERIYIAHCRGHYKET